MGASPICPVGGSVARGIATFVCNRNQVLKVNMCIRDERQGCSQGVRHQKKGMCVCMDLISPARVEGLSVGTTPGGALKQTLMYVCFLSAFPPASCSLGRWSITPAAAGLGRWGSLSAALRCSASMRAAQASGTSTPGFQL